MITAQEAFETLERAGCLITSRTFPILVYVVMDGNHDFPDSDARPPEPGVLMFDDRGEVDEDVFFDSLDAAGKDPEDVRALLESVRAESAS